MGMIFTQKDGAGPCRPLCSVLHCLWVLSNGADVLKAEKSPNFSNFHEFIPFLYPNFHELISIFRSSDLVRCLLIFFYVQQKRS